MIRHRFGSSAPAILLSLIGLSAAACGASKPPSCAVQTPAQTPGAAELPSDPATDAKLRAAVASPDRPPAESARDKWRHPVETLEFFGIRDTSSVVELWPGGGWYTAILAPLVADKGKLVVTSFDPSAPNGGESSKSFAQRLASKPGEFGKVTVQIVHPPADVTLGPDGSADVVVTFRNIHNWVDGGFADKVFAAAFRVLKPGGVLGVEEHRANADANPTKAAASGYVPESFVVDLAQQAGFHLEAKSEINANPRDTKDYPKGVWTLPPSYRLGDQDHAKYEAIGESDRMTLRFRKP